MSSTNILGSVLRNIRRKYGDKSIMTARELIERKPMKLVPTGCFQVDRIFGGGLPTRIPILIYGNAGSGKTTIVNAAAANIIRRNPNAIVIYVQTEGDVPYRAWELFGIPGTDRILVFHQNQYGEHIVDAVYETLKSLKPSLDSGELEIGALIFDSVSGLLPYQDLQQVEAKGSEAQTMATHPRMVSQFLRRFGGTGLFAYSLTIIISQVREQVGPVQKPRTITGGHALLHWCKVHMEMNTSAGRRITRADLKGMECVPGLEYLSKLQDREIVGHIVDVSLHRNSTSFGKPRDNCQYRVIYGYGFDNITPVIDAAIRYGIVQQRGSVFEYGGIKVAGKTQMVGRLFQEGMWERLQDQVHALLFQDPYLQPNDEPLSMEAVPDDEEELLLAEGMEG